MNKLALAAALAFMIGGAAQAKLIELVPEARSHAPPAPARLVDGSVRPQAALPPASMSELPEPDVFAMMLVGLILLGFRARRDSNEKFKK